METLSDVYTVALFVVGVKHGYSLFGRTTHMIVSGAFDVVVYIRYAHYLMLIVTPRQLTQLLHHK